MLEMSRFSRATRRQLHPAGVEVLAEVLDHPELPEEIGTGAGQHQRRVLL